MAGIIAMLLHSVTDFNMHNGADGLYFFFLCGLMVASVNSRFSFHDSTSMLKHQPAGRNVGYLVATALFLVCTAAIQFGSLRARAEYARVDDIYVSRTLSSSKVQEIVARAEVAAKLDPFEQNYSYKLGTIAWYQKDREEARRHFLEAARKSPMAGASLQWLGLLATDDAIAKLLMEHGYQRALNKDELALTFIEFLLWRGERQKALEVMTERLEKNGALIRKWMPLLESFSFGREEISAILPKETAAWISWGEYLQKAGDLEGAEHYRSTALTFISAEDKVQPQWYQQLISFYHETGRPEKALAVLRKAAEVVPSHAPFHLQLGDYFLQEGIRFKAQEEYQRALMLDPGNQSAQNRLRKMGLLDAY
jgi:tetratricopeptide (TPR) repeat protein